MENKLKALVLEDKQDVFEKIEESLSEFNVFPSSNNKTKVFEYELSDFHYLKNEIFKKLKSSSEKSDSKELNAEDKTKRNEAFDKILKQNTDNFINYDLYIVDLELKLDQIDNLGVDFLNYIEDNGLVKNASIVILTNSSSPPTITGVTDEEFSVKYKFIPKSGNWESDLKGCISDFKDITVSEKTTRKKEVAPKKTLSHWLDYGIQSFFLMLVIATIFLVGKNVIYEDLAYGNKSIKQTVSNTSTENNNLHSVDITNLKTLDGFSDTTKKKIQFSDTLAKSSNNVNDLELKEFEKGKANDLKMLKFSEHIFLYLIPFFIIFGFYSYYYFEFRRILLKLPLSPKDSLIAKNSILVTKTLFMSSILSYTIIKVIEKIFDGKPITLIEGSAYGVFLLLLMSYLVISNKSHN